MSGAARLPYIAAAIGVVAMVLARLLSLFAHTPLAGAYLFAWLFWLGLPLGALAILMLIELIGGRLDTVLGATLRTVTLSLAPLAILSAPILLRPSAFYPWARAGGIPPDNPFYLQPGFFDLRAIVYLAIWLVLAALFLTPVRRRVLAAVGLIVHSLIVTFAAFDWAMSLEPHWHSSEYGLLLLCGQMLGALALAAVWRFGPGKGDDSHDTGTLLLGGVIVWLYLQTMQFIVIYDGNLPVEIPWLQLRENGVWRDLLLLSLLCEFLVPFFALIGARVRNDPRAVAALGVLILVGHLLDTAWLVLPPFGMSIGLFIEDILTLIALGGFALAGGCFVARHWLPHQPLGTEGMADHG
jgi:hypothetical protein